MIKEDVKTAGGMKKSAVSPRDKGYAEATASRPPILQTHGATLGGCVCVYMWKCRHRKEGRYSCPAHRFAQGLSG